MSSDQDLIEAMQLPWPTVFTTVDIAVYHMESSTYLLGRKSHEKWRFPGGFMDVADVSQVAAAQRELQEETGLVIPLDKLWRVGDFPINDKRYANTPHRVQTNLFTSQWHGEKIEAKAADDLIDLFWCPGYWLMHPEEGYKKMLIDAHHVLWEGLVDHYARDDSWYG